MQEPVSPTEREDLRTENCLLELVLAHHPVSLTPEELERQMSTGSDAFERALRELTGSGLLRRDGDSVLPTYAALAFDRLSA